MTLYNLTNSNNEKELLKAYTKILRDEEFNNKSKQSVYKIKKGNYTYKYTLNKKGQSVIVKEGQDYWKKSIITTVNGHIYKNIEKQDGDTVNKYQKCIDLQDNQDIIKVKDLGKTEEEDIMSDFEII
jgi:hypothetical protein